MSLLSVHVAPFDSVDHVYQLVVPSSDPIYVFCRQINYCAQGMVFAINPPSFSDFQTRAMEYPLGPDPLPGIDLSSFPTSSIPPATITANHLIQVSEENQLSYVPSHVDVTPGDSIIFQFTRGNHSVTQSSFDSPCVPLAETSADGRAGFDSGL